MSMKKSNEKFGNQTRDLLACSAVPQPTTPLCAPCVTVALGNLSRKPTEKTANGTGKKVVGHADHSQQSEGSVLSVPVLY
jgi:hypothetical protein